MVKVIKDDIRELKDSDLPSIVYKYRSWDDPYHQEVIRSQSFWFASPSSFEDPLDCKNQLRYDLLTMDDIYNFYLSESFLNNDFSMEDHIRWATDWTRNSPLHNEGFVKEAQEKSHQEFCNMFGVLSLTAKPLELSMWEKYGDDSKGFAIGLNAEIAFNYFGGGGEVIYADELPIIMPRPVDSFEVQHFKQIFYKERKWEFEKEYRVHKFSVTKEPLTNEERLVQIPKNAIVEIIFGQKMNENHKEEIIEICVSEGLQLKFREVVDVGGELSLIGTT